MKKRGFGMGKWNGFGGKVEPNETVEAATFRELKEESGVVVSQAQKHAEITFLFPHKPEWNQIVHVFVTDKFSGVPVETEEMKPGWFDIDKIPVDKMWSDDPHWLPHVLAGKFVIATFSFAPDESILEKEVNVK